MDRIEILVDQRQRITHKILINCLIAAVVAISVAIGVLGLVLVAAIFIAESLSTKAVLALIAVGCVLMPFGAFRLRFVRKIADGEMAFIDVTNKVIHVVREGFRHLSYDHIPFSSIEHLSCLFIHGRSNVALSLDGKEVVVSSWLSQFYVIVALVDGQSRLVTSTPNRRNFNRIVQSLESAFSPAVSYEEFTTSKSSLRPIPRFKNNYYTFANTHYNYKYSPNHYLGSFVVTSAIFFALSIATLAEEQPLWSNWVPGLMFLIMAFHSLLRYLACRKEYKTLRHNMDKQNPPRSLPYS